VDNTGWGEGRGVPSTAGIVSWERLCGAHSPEKKFNFFEIASFGAF